MQRPLPDNTQHPPEADIHITRGIRTCNFRNRLAQNPRHNCAATEISTLLLLYANYPKPNLAWVKYPKCVITMTIISKMGLVEVMTKLPCY
jgi:hypothetical protein